jgi:pre-mRNA-processing factor 19
VSRWRKKRPIADTTATADQVAKLTAAHSYAPHSASLPGLTALAVHPAAENAHIVALGGKDKEVTVFDAEAGRVLARAVGHGKRVSSVEFHAHRDVLLTGSYDATVRLWANTSVPPTPFSGTYSPAFTLSHHRAEITCATFHPVADHAVAVARDASWSIIDLAAGRPVVLFHASATPAGSGNDMRFESASMHPDGMLLMCGCSDGLIRVYDLRTSTQATTMRHAEADSARATVRAVAMNENGYIYASGGDNGLVRVWDLRSQASVKTASVADPTAGDEAAASAAAAGAPDVAVSTLSFDWSGRHMAAGSTAGTVAVWGGKTWESEAVLRGHTGPVTAARFAAHGHRMYTASMDRNLTVWTAGAAK